jgi:hypothetical protein
MLRKLQGIILKLQFFSQKLQEIVLFRPVLGKNRCAARQKQRAAKKPQ